MADWSPRRRDGLPDGQDDNIKRKTEHMNATQAEFAISSNLPNSRFVKDYFSAKIICKYPMCANTHIRRLINVDLTRLIQM